MNPSLTQIWEAILLLKKKLINFDDTFAHAILSFQNDEVEVFINEFTKKVVDYPSIVVADNAMRQLNGLHSRFCQKGLMELELVKSGKFSEAQLSFAKLYLPYALLPTYAKNQKRAITVSHFAQSLDGKIATSSGQSQWIGNKENLVHAHRMRALCDAILIGSNTLKRDNPSLTVREVPGDNPVKIVVGNAEDEDFDNLIKDKARVLHFTNQTTGNPGEAVETIVGTACDGFIRCDKILTALYSKGIHSIYIEGGNKTSSIFLNENAIDIVQLHIAPMILGSGINNFSLPSINSIDESISFSKYFFTPIGNHIMFTGEVLQK